MNRVTLSCIALFFMTSTTLFAGGLLTNTNQSIHFNRMFAREGTIGIDGVYSNHQIRITKATINGEKPVIKPIPTPLERLKEQNPEMREKIMERRREREKWRKND